MVLDISPALLDRVVVDAEAGYPHEVCGLLLGSRHGDRAGVWALRQSPNGIDGDRRFAFCIPAEWMFHTQQVTSRSDWEIIGAYHSHCDASSHPSKRDRQKAWPELIYMIASVWSGRFDECDAWIMRMGCEEFERVAISHQ